MNKSHKGSTSFLGVLMGKTLESVTRICHVNYFVSVHSTAHGPNQRPCKRAGLCYFSPGLTEAGKPKKKRQKPPIKTVLAGERSAGQHLAPSLKPPQRALLAPRNKRSSSQRCDCSTVEWGEG